MYVRDYMSTKLVTASPGSMLLETLQPLLGGKFRHLPICEDGRLVGLVTQTDLLRVVWIQAQQQTGRLDLLDRLGHMPIRSVMVHPVITIAPGEAVEHAALSMRDHKIGCLPVVDDGDRLVGILTETNVFDAMVDALGLRRGGARVDLPIPRDREGETVAGLVERWRADGLWPVAMAIYRSRAGHEPHLVARVRGHAHERDANE